MVLLSEYGPVAVVTPRHSVSAGAWLWQRNAPRTQPPLLGKETSRSCPADDSALATRCNALHTVDLCTLNTSPTTDWKVPQAKNSG